MKKILCIIPFYNRAHLLRDAIESILQQTYSNIELVLVNDGSTDDYLEVINPYLDRSNIHFITYKENKGVAYARNQGLDYLNRLNCDYFTIHDSDDVSDITRFEKIISKFTPNTLGISTTYIKTDIENNPLMFNNQYNIKSSEGIAFYSKQTFDLLGYFHKYPAGEDTDYWWRLQKFVEINKEYDIKEDDEILYYARTHDNNTSTNYKSSYPHIWNQIRNDVYEMSKTGNFYREKFD